MTLLLESLNFEVRFALPRDGSSYQSDVSGNLDWCPVVDQVARGYVLSLSYIWLHWLGCKLFLVC